MFDRPSLNISAVAFQPDSSVPLLLDTGFMTSRLGNEDTGFFRNRHSLDEKIRDIGMSWNGNRGLNWVEEGSMAGQTIFLQVKWSFSALNVEETKWRGNRTFTRTGDFLTEFVELEDGRSFRKSYTRTYDFLQPVLKTQADWDDPDF